ncbi:MAG: hypothetical protein JSR45_09955 [Proteobacteria bacterium]|nr:hypothetical protein [Pseudomonadota bacterium]
MRLSILKVAAISGVAALLAGWAAVADGAPPAKPNGAQTGRQCFPAREVANFAAPDDHTVYLRAGVKDIYRAEVFGGCLDIDWSLRIGIRSYGSSFICVGDPAELIVPNRTIGTQRCQVKIAAKLTPEEVAALPKRARP